MDKMIDKYCDLTQASLWERFWDPNEGYLVSNYPPDKENMWCYWWNAHALDTLLDGYLRTKDSKYMDRIKLEYKGVYAKNGRTFLHNWYDDMEWIALALLRIFDETHEDLYKEQTIIIWNDIKTAWNDHMGGGLAWKKDQLDYKNTPANGPAAILAFRLYQRFHIEDDFLWGRKILDWNMKNLVDTTTGFVWDGINRMGDGSIDYEWKYTYCQGVIIGALIEEYNISKNQESLDAAVKAAREAKKQFADTNGGIFPYEGEADCGLFKGILMRYVFELVTICPDLLDLTSLILENADCVIRNGINKDNLIGGDWRVEDQKHIDLAQHLSGVMVLEMAAKLAD